MFRGVAAFFGTVLPEVEYNHAGRAVTGIAGDAGGLNGNGRTYLADNTNHNTPFIVGVSGHRDLCPEALPHIRGAVTDYLHPLRRH